MPFVRVFLRTLMVNAGQARTVRWLSVKVQNYFANSCRGCIEDLLWNFVLKAAPRARAVHADNQ